MTDEKKPDVPFPQQMEDRNKELQTHQSTPPCGHGDKSTDEAEEDTPQEQENE